MSRCACCVEIHMEPFRLILHNAHPAEIMAACRQQTWMACPRMAIQVAADGRAPP